MDSAKTFLSDNINKIKTVSACVCAVGISAILYKKLWANRRKQGICGVDYPKDTVMLHQFLRGKFAPTLGHFVMKLETYLRIAKIPYKSVYGVDMGPKKKIPWIEYNGVTLGDSQLIIDFLNKEFNVNLNKSLSEQQRAMAWAIQKWIEEFTYHLNVYTKWCIYPGEFAVCLPQLPKYVQYGYTRVIRKLEYAVGTARHSDQEVQDMIVFDLIQLSVILGDKKFLMGGKDPTEVDCAVFGILCQIRWHTPDACRGKQLLIGELTNLMAYIDRIKHAYWPDWGSLLYDATQ